MWRVGEYMFYLYISLLHPPLSSPVNLSPLLPFLLPLLFVTCVFSLYPSSSPPPPLHSLLFFVHRNFGCPIRCIKDSKELLQRLQALGSDISGSGQSTKQKKVDNNKPNENIQTDITEEEDVGMLNKHPLLLFLSYLCEGTLKN